MAMRVATIAAFVLAAMLLLAPGDGTVAAPETARLGVDDGFCRELPREDMDGFWRDRPHPATPTDVSLV